MKPTLSVVISAYNEERLLPRCLRSVRDLADEIIVVDNSSVDQTAALAKKFGCIVIQKTNDLMLNINKNIGFSASTGTWILNLDADEEVPLELAVEIRKTIRSRTPYKGFWIKRKNISFGKWIRHGLWWPDKQIRLFRKGFGSFPCVHIHEYLRVDGEVGELEIPYNHYNYDSVHQYLTKIDRASTSEALSLKETAYPFRWFDAIRFPFSDFLKIYFAQKGYKDGLHGLVLALFQAFYSFCTFAKYWEMQQAPHKDVSIDEIAKEVQRNKKEIEYWVLSAKIGEAKNPFKKQLLKIRRKSLKLS